HSQFESQGHVLDVVLWDSRTRYENDSDAAYLACLSHEAARTTKLLVLGRLSGVSAEGKLGHIHLTPPGGDAVLLVVRDRSVPMGRLAIIAQRAAAAARRWLELDR